jgi:hypothetical protein
MNLSKYFTAVKNNFQSNDPEIIGQNWLDLVSLVRHSLCEQLKKLSTQHTTHERVEYLFLPSESVGMRWKVDKLLFDVFGVNGTDKLFNVQLEDSRLKLSILIEDLKKVITVASMENLDQQFEEHSLKKEIKTVKRVRESMEVDEKISRKAKAEMEKEANLKAFVAEKFIIGKQNEKIPLHLFRLFFIDFLHKQRILLQINEKQLIEVMERMYPKFINNEKTHILRLKYQPNLQI